MVVENSMRKNLCKQPFEDAVIKSPDLSQMGVASATLLVSLKTNSFPLCLWI